MARAGLTPKAVAQEAAKVCDEKGAASLSLATVAKRFGVAVPSLYKHVDGLGGLRREVALLALAELGAALRRATTGRSGPDAMRALSRAYRGYAKAHPGRYSALQQAPGSGDAEATAAAEEVLEVIFAVLRGFAVPEGSMVDAVRAFRSTVHGFVDLEARGAFGLPQDVDRSYGLLVEGFIGTLVSWPPTESPTESMDPDNRKKG
ncbi:TetR family transcriptional regulator [Murinocardiopsis flavida]|uniref:TetR family transcriptional regulator n=1 Tax=Murinocardiopsis flavida TaxID=645275 RepID=A0A2P8DK63_9ACTN|nr:TetR-like C-terminal domain-containing protein [Murinocardiopsis flavida]PSK97615.1 TetR family transcriptional regulator [Murinocardiopsis flavida]